jgi:hypothetical protein
MRWVIVNDSGEQTIYGRIDDDGLMRVTCVAEHPEFAEWVGAGGVPEIVGGSE